MDAAARDHDRLERRIRETSIVGRRASNSIEREWSRYFDALDLSCERLLVTVGLHPVGSRDHGPAVQTRHCVHRARPLSAIRYDPRSDEIEVAVATGQSRGAALRYFVCTPQSIRLEELDHTKVISVLDASGVQTRIFLFDAR
jgi:hypothetical protein